jgi:predicted O-methyltransferase YrrM
LVRKLRPQSCLELGGAIGISAAYQGAALELNGGGVLRSVEGWVNLVTEARELLGRLRLDRVEVIHSRFEDVLEEMLPRIAPIDLVFLDASKRLEDNLRQFEQLLPHFASGGVLVLDDVHWSPEMKRAWGEIRSHPRVSLSVDLWRLGVCVLRG